MPLMEEGGVEDVSLEEGKILVGYGEVVLGMAECGSGRPDVLDEPAPGPPEYNDRQYREVGSE